MRAHSKEELNVMPYSASQLYQAERVKSDAERRQADVALGMMAADVSQLWGQVTRPVRVLRGYVLDYRRTTGSRESDLAACEAKAA
jgi:hypothetical protein